MSAARLRDAAALMRLNASEADTNWSWIAEGSFVDTDPECGFNAGTSLLAEHIASWHPAVALAVADWLEAEAESHRADVVGPFPSACCRMGQALAVADAYLGSTDADLG